MALDLSATSFPILPSPDARPFWEAADRGELVLPRCDACAATFWYPRAHCPTCGSRAVTWVPASPHGTLHAFCIHHSTPLAHLRDLVPFVTALVDLADGPRMMGLLEVAPDPAAIRCDMPVEVQLRATAEGPRVPIFVPTQLTREPTT